MDHYDIVIIGAGLAGSLAAIALARNGHRVALVGPKPAIADGRTTALMDQSIEYLKKLQLWDETVPLTAPLVAIHIIDDTKRLLRAPPVNFRASEVGLDAFGYNIPNAPFLEILEKHEAGLPTLDRMTVAATTFDFEEEEVRIGLDDGRTITADLIIGADGRRSAVREAAGISVHTWSYPQTAVVLNFGHELPHHDVSTEFHTEAGPFTQVPLPGNRSSLVWVQKPRDAEERLKLAPDVLSRTIEGRLQSILGKVTAEGIPQSFPLSGMTARRFGKGRTMLVGEAAHAFPPIGAQGLNLSLRDVMTLVELVGSSTGGRLPADTGDRFDSRRRIDIVSRTASVDLLNRSLLSGFLPVQALRAVGLHLLSSAGPLRGLLMREGIHPGSAIHALKEGLREKISGKSA
ncbi:MULTISPECIES: UbiH/UbiF family hydroxylase [unclassified Sinorhizobium]|uniref:UbiH/UbiF family hydroxylase n=1 Tax=unclassified Sinorhizobium TaxID=2613772 RepID=UPI0024C2349D|nr:MULTISPECIES: UbiH/UbiF family hydroxylase [unclassified Sinorhizobium]MDK1372880.1 UbiH/UbiF family hydroxylase [Sinorhizobium sp. 6-70]MDK1477150.1 UbiH/UbiF family hydroxylase [Sinorhizobium sp. 6-117]MDK1477181.1 UbiH/UbiF family hydroxylase [Sinorhizobium sp. 6-117]